MTRKQYKKIYESVMKLASKLVVEKLLSDDVEGFDIVYPSVKRWLDDQLGEPENADEVRQFLDAKDPGYKLMTIRNQKIVQDLVNAYLNDNVAWLNYNFQTVLSYEEKLGLVSWNYDIPVIVYYVEYDYDIPFLKNLENLYTSAADYLAEFATTELFDECCEEAVENALADNKKAAKIYNI